MLLSRVCETSWMLACLNVRFCTKLVRKGFLWIGSAFRRNSLFELRQDFMIRIIVDVYWDKCHWYLTKHKCFKAMINQKGWNRYFSWTKCWGQKLQMAICCSRCICLCLGNDLSRVLNARAFTFDVVEAIITDYSSIDRRCPYMNTSIISKMQVRWNFIVLLYMHGNL